MDTLFPATTVLEFDAGCITTPFDTELKPDCFLPIPKRVRSVSDCDQIGQIRRDITVNGGDHGDVPFTFVVKEIGPSELPVIGTYVDPRIVRGFSYRVRILGSERYLFDGQAVELKSVGMGYGKRIATTGGHFYSDTHPGGVAFSLQGGVKTGDKLAVSNSDGRLAGTVIIDRILSRREVWLDEVEANVLQKNLMVTWSGELQLASNPHGVKPLQSYLHLEVSTLISMVKSPSRGIKKSFESIHLPGIGHCSINFTN